MLGQRVSANRNPRGVHTHRRVCAVVQRVHENQDRADEVHDLIRRGVARDSLCRDEPIGEQESGGADPSEHIDGEGNRDHCAALSSSWSIFVSRSLATARAVSLPYGASKLAIESYDRWTPSTRSSMRIVTGAYAAASGTVVAISFMMSGFPTTRRRILGPCPPRSFRRTSPASNRTNSIRSEDPIAP